MPRAISGRSVVLSIGLAGVIGLLIIFLGLPRHRPVENLPPRLTDAEFWQLVSGFSEPDGYFRSDNFVSNETTFQHVIPELSRRTKPGGVYLGVGPDQNFTYIAALQPKVAFIIDIRRQNMLTHLMYKSIMEMSTNRAEFLSILFSRPLPANLDIDAEPAQLFEAFSMVAPSGEMFMLNFDRIVSRLTEGHGFPLNTEDIASIRYVYEAFRTAGPDIRYSYPSQWGWRRFPSYAELIVERDREGKNHSYLATEEQFKFIRQLESENRIVPIVGNFAGEKALASVGEYLKDHGATVTAFYTSNVEFYLFQNEDWKQFFKNVERLPLDGTSTLIRSYFNNGGVRFPGQRFDQRSITLLDGMDEMMTDAAAGKIRTYPDLIERSLDSGF
jgi:hypothetical protein